MWYVLLVGLFLHVALHILNGCRSGPGADWRLYWVLPIDFCKSAFMLVFIEEGYRDAYARGRRPVRVRVTQIRPLLVGQCRNKPTGVKSASRAAYGLLGAFLHGA